MQLIKMVGNVGHYLDANGNKCHNVNGDGIWRVSERSLKQLRLDDLENRSNISNRCIYENDLQEKVAAKNLGKSGIENVVQIIKMEAPQIKLGKPGRHNPFHLV